MINKPRATSDEGNQLKGSSSVQARRLIICTTTEARTSPMWIGLCCLHTLVWVWVWIWSDGNEEGTPIYAWMNSARAELHLFSILHGRIKFHLTPHGKVRNENAKVREAATYWGLFWYLRLGWELGWVPQVNNGTQPSPTTPNPTGGTRIDTTISIYLRGVGTLSPKLLICPLRCTFSQNLSSIHF
ncbi:hypothetical protein AVEN_6656-1 [Araneus ventricosus]|uniref:Uncharacterized protein n=1 Tax=Araneus ventricosus TaxID=182803 RepID=A0A4Y2H0K0_ARAVE|nr:hypothetical protein AVEN_6656-1 [Araneus ventricosus]